MPFLGVETLARFIPVRATICLIGPVTEDKIVDYVDLGLEESNREHAQKIALRVGQDIGTYRFGPMWAEWNGPLPDGRKVYLQSSDSALIIRIHPADAAPAPVTYIRWDRTQHRVNAYSVWDPNNNQFLMYYQVQEVENSIPGTLTRWHVSRDFAVVLEQIAQATQQTV